MMKKGSSKDYKGNYLNVYSVEENFENLSGRFQL